MKEFNENNRFYFPLSTAFTLTIQGNFYHYMRVQECYRKNDCPSIGSSWEDSYYFDMLDLGWIEYLEDKELTRLNFYGKAVSIFDGVIDKLYRGEDGLNFIFLLLFLLNRFDKGKELVSPKDIKENANLTSPVNLYSLLERLTDMELIDAYIDEEAGGILIKGYNKVLIEISDNFPENETTFLCYPSHTRESLQEELDMLRREKEEYYSSRKKKSSKKKKVGC